MSELREHLVQVVGDIVYQAGFDQMTRRSANLLTDLFESILLDLFTQTTRYAESCCRSGTTLLDLYQLLKAHGTNLQDLRLYALGELNENQMEGSDLYPSNCFFLKRFSFLQSRTIKLLRQGKISSPTSHVYILTLGYPSSLCHSICLSLCRLCLTRILSNALQ